MTDPIPSPCNIYDSPTLIYPQQPFPADNSVFRRMSQGEKQAAKKAWNYFEQVETADAATRVRIGQAGGVIPSQQIGSLWVSFAGEGERALYEKGRRLHMRICPTRIWTPQRNRPIPTIVPTTVAPESC